MKRMRISLYLCMGSGGSTFHQTVKFDYVSLIFKFIYLSKPSIKKFSRSSEYTIEFHDSYTAQYSQYEAAV